MKRRMFLKMSAMLGLMAAPVLRLFEQKREYITRVSVDESLLGIRITIPKEESFSVKSTTEWEISEADEDGWKNKYYITPLGLNEPKLKVCFSGCYDFNGSLRFDKNTAWKFYRV